MAEDWRTGVRLPPSPPLEVQKGSVFNHLERCLFSLKTFIALYSRPVRHEFGHEFTAVQTHPLTHTVRALYCLLTDQPPPAISHKLESSHLYWRGLADC